MRKNKIFALALTAVLSAGMLAGCGTSGSAGGTSAGAASSNAAGASSGAVSSSSAASAGAEAAASSGTSAGTASSASAAGATRVVRVAEMTNETIQYVVAVGLDQGIFDKYGLEIQETEFSAGINTADAVTLDQADVGTLADFALVNRFGAAEKMQLGILDTHSRSLPDVETSSRLYVNPDKVDPDNVKESLKGAAFATATGTVQDYYVAKTYEYLGYDEKDQNIVQLGNFADMYAAAASGQVDAVWANGINATKLKDAGMVATLKQTDIGVTTNACTIASQKFLDENPDTAVDFLKAFQETADYMKDHVEESAKIIEKKTTTPADIVAASLEATDISLGFSQDDLDHLTDLQTWAKDNGKLKFDYDLKSYIRSDLLEKAIPGSVTYQ
ncbi:MAG: ABC transporter substrate-binding protein [Eubacterium sp.]|nr:ABC transporter substrate-binding protein [Eubacterium sp.]